MKIMEFYLHCYCGKADMSVEIAEVLIILCAQSLVTLHRCTYCLNIIFFTFEFCGCSMDRM